MRRPVLLGAAWVAAAAAAVGLGFLAVSFVGASASPSASFLAATGSLAGASGEGSTATSSAPSAVATARRDTPGGTVVAHCTGGTAELAGAPAAGWWTDDASGRGAVEFSNGTQKVEVRATCPNGTPSFTVEGPGTVSQSSTTGSQSPATDDHGGLRGGSGSGSGKGGGGHGSDG